MSKYDITVEGSHLYGDNAFAIIALVQKTLKREVGVEEANAFSREAMNSESYDGLWDCCREWVNVA